VEATVLLEEGTLTSAIVPSGSSTGEREATELRQCPKGYSTSVGDEGGFASNLKSNVEAVEVILEADSKASYRPGEDIALCLDPATSEMWDDDAYLFFKSDKSRKSSDEMVDLWTARARQYPLLRWDDERMLDGQKAPKAALNDIALQLQRILRFD
jgi:enolase